MKTNFESHIKELEKFITLYEKHHDTIKMFMIVSYLDMQKYCSL